MSIEQHFADAINANPDDRTLQLVYADWLDEQGDPRAEAWRVLIEKGKRPYYEDGNSGLGYENTWKWCYFSREPFWPASSSLLGVIGEFDYWRGMSRFSACWSSKSTFHAAMNAAAIAWVRCHRDAGYEPDELTERVI